MSELFVEQSDEVEVSKYSAPLDDRMKDYERVFTDQKIDHSLPFVMRLDGHGFSKFTRGLHKPYDYNFQKIFAVTTMELMKEYKADLGYTHSDEITLLFYPKKTKNGDAWREPHFGGRIQKIISTAAAFCTMVFNREGRKIYASLEEDYRLSADEPVKQVYYRIIEGSAYFDCRMFQLPTDAEMFSHMFWRSQIDCRRNHVFELSRRYYTKSELHGVGTKNRIEMLAAKGVNWSQEPACFRRGAFFKRVPKKMDDPKVIRYEIKDVPIELSKFDEEINETLKCEVYQSPYNLNCKCKDFQLMQDPFKFQPDFEQILLKFNFPYYFKRGATYYVPYISAEKSEPVYEALRRECCDISSVDYSKGKGEFYILSGNKYQYQMNVENAENVEN